MKLTKEIIEEMILLELENLEFGDPIFVDKPPAAEEEEEEEEDLSPEGVMKKVGKDLDSLCKDFGICTEEELEKAGKDLEKTIELTPQMRKDIEANGAASLGSPTGKVMMDPDYEEPEKETPSPAEPVTAEPEVTPTVAPEPSTVTATKEEHPEELFSTPQEPFIKKGEKLKLGKIGKSLVGATLRRSEMDISRVLRRLHRRTLENAEKMTGTKNVELANRAGVVKAIMDDIVKYIKQIRTSIVESKNHYQFKPVTKKFLYYLYKEMNK